MDAIIASKNRSESIIRQTPQPIKAYKILGLTFHSLSIQETVTVLEKYLQERRPTQVSFANAYTVALCQSNPELRDLINKSHLSLADGMSIVWGARWLKIRLPGRVGGPDLTEALCKRAAEKGYKIFLMGSTWDNLHQLKASLTKRYPAISIVGMHSPPMCDKFSEEETAGIIKQLNHTKPDILLVGVSCPKQERWIAENLKRLGVPLCLAVGAAFDFISGRIPRAPEFMQKSGLEWVHRLWCEPRRLWKRYLLGNFVFLSLLLREAVKLRLTR